MIQTKAYHAHVYYRIADKEAARVLCEGASEKFGVRMGRMHDGPVGPHPVGSCQLSVPARKMDDLVAWLDDNRGELTVLLHSLTGDELRDHTEGVGWLGEPMALDISIFQ